MSTPVVPLMAIVELVLPLEILKQLETGQSSCLFSVMMIGMGQNGPVSSSICKFNTYDKSESSNDWVCWGSIRKIRPSTARICEFWETASTSTRQKERATTRIVSWNIELGRENAIWLCCFSKIDRKSCGIMRQQDARLGCANLTLVVRS